MQLAAAQGNSNSSSKGLASPRSPRKKDDSVKSSTKKGDDDEHVLELIVKMDSHLAALEAKARH